MSTRTGKFARLAAALGIAAALGLLTACGSGGTTETATQPLPSETALTPDVSSPNNQQSEHDPVVTPENEADLLAELRIPENASAEQKIAKILEISSRWSMAGATPEIIYQVQQALIDANGETSEDIAREAALANRDVFAVALYGADWQEHDYARDIVNNTVDLNAANLVRYVSTFGNEEFPNTNSKNREAYEESISSAALVDQADADTPVRTALAKEIYNRASAAFGTRDIEVFAFTGVRENNSESTMFSENPDYAEMDGQLLYFSAVLTPDGNGNLYAFHVGSDSNGSYSIPY